MHVSPGAAAFGVDDGAFYSASSLFVPLAIAEIDERDLATRKIDLERARRSAVVIDVLNTALTQAGFKTYRSYEAAVASGRKSAHPAVDSAYAAAANLTPADCMNLRRALDHLALAGRNAAERALMRSGARPDPWASAADTLHRALEQAL